MKAVGENLEITAKLKSAARIIQNRIFGKKILAHSLGVKTNG